MCLFTRGRSDMQIESDLRCPGGKARIIHKESDIITAFAINKVQFLTLLCALYIIVVWNRESCMLEVFQHWAIYFADDGAR